MTPLTPPRRARRASADAASLQIAAQSAKQPCPNRARGAAAATAARAARRDGGDEVKNTSARALLCFLLRPIARAEIARPRRGLHRRTCPRTPSPLTPHPPRTSRAQNAPPRKRRSPGKPLDRSANFGLFAVARDDVARRESLTAAVIERNWEDVYVCGKCLEPKPKGHARNCRGFPVAPQPPPALPALQADGTAPRVSARENKQRPRVRF